MIAVNGVGILLLVSSSAGDHLEVVVHAEGFTESGTEYYSALV